LTVLFLHGSLRTGNFCFLKSETPTALILMKKILIVDDEPSVLKSLERLLKSLGYEVITANSGYDGMHKLEADPEINVALIDVNCDNGTGMDGILLVSTMRKYRYSTPVVFMSGDLHPHVPREMTALSSYYLAKPFTSKAVVAFLKAAYESVPSPAGAH
jgi:DNA-binding NtrC family response regulator